MMIRYHIGRALIHFGLRVLPPGRVKNELNALIAIWSRTVMEAIAAAKAGDGG